jgi:hypothetical protein
MAQDEAAQDKESIYRQIAPGKQRSKPKVLGHLRVAQDVQANHPPGQDRANAGKLVDHVAPELTGMLLRKDTSAASLET